MDKRTLLAIVLSILVLLVFRYIEERRAPAPRPRTPVAVKAPVPTATGPAPKSEPRTPEKPAPETALQAGGADTAAEATTIVIECDLYRAVVDNRGGVVRSWILKNYKAGDGKPLEMVPAGLSPEAPRFPGTLIFEDPKMNWEAGTSNYELRMQGKEAAAGTYSPPVKVGLLLRRGDLEVEKELNFSADNYLVDFAVRVRHREEPPFFRVLLGEDTGPEHEHLSNPSFQLQSISSRAGKIHRDGPPDNEGEVTRIDGEIRWVGLDIHYFSMIAIPPSPFATFELQKKLVKTTGLNGKEAERILMPLTLPVTGNTRFRLFLGPKDQEVLESVQDADLSGVIDFGMFSFLVRPLLFSLKWLNAYIHNYGVSIILLTLLLSLLLFPFRLKQMLSMKKMQVIQPKVKQIQEKYKKYKKTDPARAKMNQEVMALYKEHNVNPLGGCLPLILQMPLLFAFYQLLASSIELRQAPFVGWIHDLSVKDPFYVLPIVMGATMFISQKMTPMSPGMDPTQAKMMLMMPAIFTVMFLNVSSGLNLYFLCSNIFQISFQKVAERWVGDGKSKPKSKS